MNLITIINLDIIPKNSSDAISYGYLKLLFNEVEMLHNLDVCVNRWRCTEVNQIYFLMQSVDNELIFNSMKKIIKKARFMLTVALPKGRIAKETLGNI